jgi:hypothetical protein
MHVISNERQSKASTLALPTPKTTPIVPPNRLVISASIRFRSESEGRKTERGCSEGRKPSPRASSTALIRPSPATFSSRARATGSLRSMIVRSGGSLVDTEVTRASFWTRKPAPRETSVSSRVQREVMVVQRGEENWMEYKGDFVGGKSNEREIGFVKRRREWMVSGKISQDLPNKKRLSVSEECM